MCCKSSSPRYPEQDPAIFSVTGDGTRDITGTGLESVCSRYDAENLVQGEVFVGFYAIDYAKRRTLAMAIKDVLLHLQLPISLLRGQTYDGAADMPSTNNGAQCIFLVIV